MQNAKIAHKLKNIETKGEDGQLSANPGPFSIKHKIYALVIIREIARKWQIHVFHKRKFAYFM